jgi:predicted  nucleic acid-binding Zn-ribbon protein
MKQTVKMLKVEGNEPQTVDAVRGALSAIIDDIKSGDATVAEAEPIKKGIENRIEEIRAQMESAARRQGYAQIIFW